MILRALLVLVCAALLPVVVPAAAGAPRHGDAAQQQAPNQASGLEARLGRVQSTLADLAARERALASRRTATAARLLAARQSLAVAQRRLANRLRALYKEDEAHPLDVILGAASFDEALSDLDNLERTARHDRAWIERSRSLRASLLVLSRSLAERTREVRRLRRSTEATVLALAALRRSELARAAASVQTAPQQPRTLAVAASPQPAVGPSHAPAPSPPPLPSAGARTLTVEATAYALPGFTATGSPVGPGTVAVDPAVIPLGSRLEIPGYGAGVAADTGPSVTGARIDVWFATIEQARAWGTRTVTITVTGG